MGAKEWTRPASSSLKIIYFIDLNIIECYNMCNIDKLLAIEYDGLVWIFVGFILLTWNIMLL